MCKFVLVESEKYKIVKEDNISPYINIYTLKNKDNIFYRLLIEDYREASFMYDKFHKAVINPHQEGRLKTVKIGDIKFEIDAEK